MKFCNGNKDFGRNCSFAAFIIGVGSLRQVYRLPHFGLCQIGILTQISDSLKFHIITNFIIRRTDCSIDIKNNLFYNVFEICKYYSSQITFNAEYRNTMFKPSAKEKEK